MKKSIFFIGILIGSISCEAMDVVSVPDASSKTVTLLAGTHQDPIKISVRHAKQLIGICDLLTYSDSEEDIPVPVVAKNILEAICAQLERIALYGEGRDKKLIDAIYDDFKKLDDDTLIEVLRAADYLNVVILLNAAFSIAKERSLEKASLENLSSLHIRISRLLLEYRIAAMLGVTHERGNYYSQQDLSKVPVVTPLTTYNCRTGGIECVAVTHDDKIIFGSDGMVRIVDRAGTELAAWRLEEQVTVICVTPDNKIVTGSSNGIIRIWDMAGNQLAQCEGHQQHIKSLFITPDLKIVSSAGDYTVRIWDMFGREIAVCANSFIAALTSDNKIVTGEMLTGTMRIFDISGNQLAQWQGHQDQIWSLTVTNDNKIVSGSKDTTICVWDTSGNRLAECKGHEGGVTTLFVTADHKIVSGSEDTTVRIWDSTGNQLAVCKGHESPVTAVQATSEGRIVSSSSDFSVRIWDIKGKQIGLCRGHTEAVQKLCLAADDSIISASYDRTLIIWDMQKVLLLLQIASITHDQATAIWALLQKWASPDADKQSYVNMIVEVITGKQHSEFQPEAQESSTTCSTSSIH